jgi:2'-5' RNA ligase
MRIFTGVFLPPPIAADVRAAVADAGQAIRTRWIPPANLHLTLTFLGDVQDRALADVERALREAAMTVPAFTVRLGGFGAFPNLRRARVAYVGVQEGGEDLAQLAGAFVGALPPALRPDDRRPFRAHLTMARLRQPPEEQALQALAGELEPLQWRFDVGEARVVESVLSPQGARYETRAVAPLAARPAP